MMKTGRRARKIIISYEAWEVKPPTRLLLERRGLSDSGIRIQSWRATFLIRPGTFSVLDGSLPLVY